MWILINLSLPFLPEANMLSVGLSAERVREREEKKVKRELHVLNACEYHTKNTKVLMFTKLIACCVYSPAGGQLGTREEGAR